MVRAETLSKKSKNNQKMGVRDGLVAKKANQSKEMPVKKGAPMKAENKGKGKNVPVPKGGGKNKGGKQALNKKELKPKAEESDEEIDSDMESDEESMEESPQKKGVKMFEGVQNSDDESDEEDDDSDVAEGSADEEEDEDDDDDEEDEDDEDEDEDGESEEESSISLKDLLGESMGDDDEDDDDFDENDSGDESDDEAVAKFDKKLRNKSSVKGKKQDEDEDEDEDEDDDDDDEDDDDSENYEDEKAPQPSLRALLAEKLVDEDDDSDFNEEGEDDSDEDISDESDEDVKNESLEKSTPPKKIKKDEQESQKPKHLSPEEKAELDARTIFVGNVPKDITPKAIKKFFRACGEVENVRVRGVVAEDSRISPKVATITKKMHPKVQTVYVYVAFKDEASAKKALEYNGKKLGDNILRVDVSDNRSKEHDHKKAVFLGNLPYDITEDEIHAHFTSCGKIESVRIIKHRQTGLNRGVGYINFVEEDSVALALELNETTLKNRLVRVTNSKPEKQDKKRKHSKKQDNQQSGKKKFKTAKGEAKITDGAGPSGKKKRSQGEKKRGKSSGDETASPAKSSFQGQQAGEKKKSKKNKLEKKKKIMSEKLTSTRKFQATE